MPFYGEWEARCNSGHFCTILLYIGALGVLVNLESVVNLRRLRIALSNFPKLPKLFIPNASNDPNVANNPQKFTIFSIFLGYARRLLITRKNRKCVNFQTSINQYVTK